MYNIDFNACPPGTVLTIASTDPQSVVCASCNANQYSVGGTDICSAYGFFVSSSQAAIYFSALIYNMGGVFIDDQNRLVVGVGASGWTKRPVIVSPVCYLLYYFFNSLLIIVFRNFERGSVSHLLVPLQTGPSC